jgi:predicted Zn finger-like uncharacterized protein
MILTCPHCATRYHLDPASLGGQARTVRCASCGHRWKVSPPSDAPTVIELTPVPLVTPRTPPPPAPASQSRHRSLSLVGWLVAALVLLLATGAIFARNEIVSGFPASAGIYQWLRLPVATEPGLKIEQFTPKHLSEGGISLVVIEGAIVNASNRGQTVPPIRITLLDDAGRPLQDGLVEAEDESLDAGGRTTFSGRLINPAQQARKVSVRFDTGS